MHPCAKICQQDLGMQMTKQPSLLAVCISARRCVTRESIGAQPQSKRSLCVYHKGTSNFGGNVLEEPVEDPRLCTAMSLSRQVLTDALALQVDRWTHAVPAGSSPVVLDVHVPVW